jgi:hypothetical protein
MKAIILSIQTLRFKFLSLLYIFVVLFLSLLLLFMPLALLIESSFAPLGIVVLLTGLSFLAPLYYNIKGILYREIFGISIATDKYIGNLQDVTKVAPKAIKSDSDDTFSA